VAVCAETIEHLRDKMKNNAYLRCGRASRAWYIASSKRPVVCRATFSEIQSRKRAVRTTILQTVPEPLIRDELDGRVCLTGAVKFLRVPHFVGLGFAGAE
jgi:hypothetical protein